MRIFKILGIEPTKNEMEIKEAYLNKLSDTNPEDKPEEFMQLRKAYEEAIEYANQEDEEDTNEIDNTEIGLWMAKVREVYNNFRARNDINAWSELLKDDVCQNIEIKTDARDALLEFFMQNYYLPSAVIRFLNEFFNFEEDIDELYESFPAEFIDNIKNNTLSHSYLFVGQEGIGKKLFAKELAKMALCLNNKTENDNCSSCVKFDSGNNPDFVLIEPDGNSIKIAQIREMQENVYTKPIVSRKKVFIINDSDKMTEEAQNSLLKTLEEPPEYIMIILITANENKLLNTIKSRCLKISFNNLETSDLISYINSVQGMQVPSENLLKMCNGSIGKLMKVNENLEEYNAVESTTNNFLNGKIPNVVKMLSQFEILYKSKEIINDLLDYMIVIIYEYINKSKDYRAKFLNLIAII